MNKNTVVRNLRILVLGAEKKLKIYPSWQLTHTSPKKGALLKMILPFPQMGYVSSLEGI